MVKLQFWPREPAFWRSHGAAMLAVVVLSLLSVGLWGHLDAGYVLASLLWMLPYTLAVLLLRWLYHARGWGHKPMTWLVPLVLAYSSVAGVVVTALVALAVLPMAAGEFSLRSVISGGLQAQLFIGAWGFIYISIQTQRREREAELSNLRLQMNLKEAQLSQLTDQLKPHFLFNALNNIRFMVQEDGPQAERMIVALSGMLRYSLDSPRRNKLPLREELAIIHDYLALVRCQLEERLRLELQIEAGLEDALVPPMMLQMLVENAIKHGLEPLPQGGRLRMVVARSGTQLQLCVGNDRTALKSDQAQSLGLGLRNVERRLQLLYGDKAQLQVQPTPAWFEVQLRLPLEPSA